MLREYGPACLSQEGTTMLSYYGTLSYESWRWLDDLLDQA